MNQQNFVFLSFIHPIWSFISIVGLLVFWFFKKKLPSIKNLKRILNIFFIIILSGAFLETFLNWWMWSKTELTQRLIPPYAPVTYVLHYSWQHYLFEPVITIIFALIIFKIIASLNKKFNNQFFYDEEPYLASLGILAISWPNCLVFLCLVLLLGVFSHILLKGKRFPLLYFWLPCALLVLLLNGIISKYLIINQFII
ncbi:MAG: hypothetical protein WC306_00255 [Candidatus Paceibacterota bacterium]|jgi:hypothetical protein